MNFGNENDSSPSMVSSREVDFKWSFSSWRLFEEYAPEKNVETCPKMFDKELEAIQQSQSTKESV